MNRQISQLEATKIKKKVFKNMIWFFENTSTLLFELLVSSHIFRYRTIFPFLEHRLYLNLISDKNLI